MKEIPSRSGDPRSTAVTRTVGSETRAQLHNYQTVHPLPLGVSGRNNSDGA
jgi:hypothetical protein